MAPSPKISGKEIYELKIETGQSWQELADHFGLSFNQVRDRARHYYKQHDLPPPGGPVNGLPQRRIVGGLDEEPRHNGQDLWQRAIAMQARQDALWTKRAERRVIFDEGPVALVAMADLHLGGMGVDYRALDQDILIIQELANQGLTVALLLVGDLLDNFVVGRLRDMRANVSPFLVVEEWGLVDYALERLAPFIIGSVAGNHDNWSWALSGVDLLRERHRELTPGILYDPYELAFILQVGGFECRVMARHKWRGNSMYNPTHALDSRQHTSGRAFDVAIAAHTHRGALAREINLGDGCGDGLLCGSYKKVDGYSLEKGFPPPLQRTAVAAVMDEGGLLFSTSRLEGLLRLAW